MQNSKFVHSCLTTDKVVSFRTWINGFMPNRTGTYGSGYNYLYADDISVKPKSFCFVHGNMDDLRAGKKCVVREKVVEIKQEGDDMDEWGYLKWLEKPVERAVIHLPNNHVILVLGKTSNGNSIIVLK